MNRIRRPDRQRERERERERETNKLGLKNFNRIIV